MKKIESVAIVGAGMSGVSCATQLRKNGFEGKIEIFEKARGAGGRMSTRREEINGTKYFFDHGAQFFTAKNAFFAKKVAEFEKSGLVELWSKGFPNEHGEFPHETHSRFYAKSGMNSLCKEMLKEFQNINLRCGVKVAKLKRIEGKVKLELEVGLGQNSEEIFDAVVISCPVPQVLEVLGSEIIDANLTVGLKRIEYYPCFAVMLSLEDGFRFEGKLGEILSKNGGLHFKQSNIFSFASGTKIKGVSQHSGLLLHTSPEFSKNKTAENKEEVLTRCLAEAEVLFGVKENNMVGKSIHFWKYSQPEESVSGVLKKMNVSEQSPFMDVFKHVGENNETYKPSEDCKVFAVGDAFCGGRVEGAYLSGVYCANHLHPKQ